MSEIKNSAIAWVGQSEGSAQAQVIRDALSVVKFKTIRKLNVSLYFYYCHVLTILKKVSDTTVPTLGSHGITVQTS